MGTFKVKGLVPSWVESSPLNLRLQTMLDNCKISEYLVSNILDILSYSTDAGQFQIIRISCIEYFGYLIIFNWCWTISNYQNILYRIFWISWIILNQLTCSQLTGNLFIWKKCDSNVRIAETVGIPCSQVLALVRISLSDFLKKSKSANGYFLNLDSLEPVSL